MVATTIPRVTVHTSRKILILLQALLCCKEIQLVNTYVGITVVIHVKVVVEIEEILGLEIQDGKTELIEELYALQVSHITL